MISAVGIELFVMRDQIDVGRIILTHPLVQELELPVLFVIPADEDVVLDFLRDKTVSFFQYGFEVGALKDFLVIFNLGDLMVKGLKDVGVEFGFGENPSVGSFTSKTLRSKSWLKFGFSVKSGL